MRVLRPVTVSVTLLGIIAAAFLAGTGADSIDTSICASDSRVVYNTSGVNVLAEAFFDQIGVSVDETIVGPSGSGPGYNRTIMLGGVPLSGFSTAGYDFRSGCEVVRAGWCGNVTFSAVWLTSSKAKANLGFSTSMCIPLSCCNSSVCQLDYGVRQFATVMLTDIVYSWCAAPPNQTWDNCPISLNSSQISINGKPWSSASSQSDAGKRVAYWMAAPDQRQTMTLPPQPAARLAFQESGSVLETPQAARSLRPAQPAQASVSRGLLGQASSASLLQQLPFSPAECSGGLVARALATDAASGDANSTLETSVTTVCVAGGLDIFTYLLVALSIVMFLCMGIACGQRYYYARRARRGLDDLPGMFVADGFREGDEDPQVRLARVAQRQQALRALAFPMGSKPLKGGSTKANTDALTTMGGSTSSRKGSMGSSVARSNPDAATSLLAGSVDADSSASSSSMAESLTGKPDESASSTVASEGPGPTVVAAAAEGTDPGEEHVDPITLDTIRDGEQVLEFPGCNHLFRLESILQWFESNETCPVCRRQFLASASTEDDAKAASA